MLLTMGLPAIDQSLEKLLAAMETFPKAALMGDAVGFARVIGLCLALCMGSYECWMMMLGKRGMDVMKLLRIVGLSMCITSSTWICNQLLIPGKALENTTKTMAETKNKEVAALELKVAQKQDDYLKRLRNIQDSLATAKQVQAIGEDAHWWDKLIYNMQNLGDTINDYAQRAAVLTDLNFQLICSDNLLRLVFLWPSSFSTYLFRLVSRFTPGWDVKPKSLRNLYLLPDKRCYLGGMPLSLDTSYVPHLVKHVQ